MTTSAWILLAVYMVVLIVLAIPLGRFMANVMEGKYAWANTLEAPLYRVAGVDATTEMDWLRYTIAILLFNGLGFVVVYVLQRLQVWLPLNPAAVANVTPDSSFNTAVSFTTNTNWQGYGGESTMSYLTQMLALAVQNFLSAATGIAVLIALVRGLARHSSATVGNAWVDLTRCTSWILLPLSVVFAVFLVSQGVVQNFDAYREVQLLEVVKYQEATNGPDRQPLKNEKGEPLMEEKSTQAQTLPMGPAASQIAIKQLGTNGGGFFNANSAHPYENPTALSDFFELLAILLIPAALCETFGVMVGDRRQGLAVLAAMTVLFLVITIPLMISEQGTNPVLAKLGVDQVASAQQSGGFMEGKETRFGIGASALWAAATTSASNGSVNAMHDSFSPIGGGLAMLNIQLGEVVFGGVGSGLYGMLVFAILGVFISGLMIGRTPEYLGKKIEVYEMKMTSIAILVTPILVLVGTAFSVMTDAGRAGMANPAAHGFSEVLYAFSSASNNNGSAFAGLSANTPFYNAALGIVMWLGRFAIIVPVMAMAGSFAAKKRIPEGSGTMPTHGPLFIAILIASVLLIGLLNYVPALALGPGVEHLMIHGGK